VPSLTLKPETSYNSELGYKLTAKDLTGSFAIFHNRLYNLITRAKVENQMIDGYNVYKKENVEKASLYGGEAYLQWRPKASWTFNGRLSYTYGENISKEEPLRRMPPLNGGATFKYSNKSFYLITELGFASKQDRLAQGDKEDNRIPPGGTPSWNVLNLYSGYQYNKTLLRVSGQNLLDRDYRTHGSGINSVGRSLVLSLQYSF
jgi:outer membrane receptor protein involved in Fe transport